MQGEIVRVTYDRKTGKKLSTVRTGVKKEIPDRAFIEAYCHLRCGMSVDQVLDAIRRETAAQNA